eukprot:GGOE01011582.1.p1 GENE.GGOE01011582.1~~GGOE01011582.1.p1  ORF type:complete len:836 (-),score=273.17 GGOE01011582.1:1347-3689(-)
MDAMAKSIQEMLMYQATEKFDARLTEGEKEMKALTLMVEASGVLSYDFHPSRFDAPTLGLTPFHTQTFTAMQGHPYFSQMSVLGTYFDLSVTYFTPIFWVTWVAFLLDVAKKTVGNRTLYVSRLEMAPNEELTTMNISYVNQVTGKPLLLMSNKTASSYGFSLVKWANGWLDNMQFNQYTGQVELALRYNLAAQNGTWIQLYISVGAATISDELRSQLNGSPDDRLVLFFRQPHGHMIAASHGKYFSHSDVDRRYLNPLVNPVNITAYRLWTCLESDDALIQDACQQLYDTHQSWTAIPAAHKDMVLSGQRYWVATGYSSGNLQCTVLMLKNRASVMGNIDTSNAQVDQRVSNKKGVTFVILGVVSAIAVLLPLSVGLWLATRLSMLASGMDRIAQLQFSTTTTPPTMFQELHRFQKSFTQMERGLQAFGKFVPQAVVKVLIAGQMSANDQMHPNELTIMFADIEGFSTVCEKETPSVIVSVCTEYFEAMCSNIIQHNGTIDKFIGDCIMAIWNAPERLLHHQRDAVAASLAMQARVMELHTGWKIRGLPILKFRVGIHTDVCLVGNFGCSYRVSYTCLGDGVNLAARLEALNKKFGTHICVSHATYESCCGHFHFRKLSKVTVPGKAEVLPVYEVVCESEYAEMCTPKGADLPGAANQPPNVPHDPNDVECIHIDTASVSTSPRIAGCRSLDLVVGSPHPGLVPYHWSYVNRAALLKYTQQYEQSYEALVAGDLAWARAQLIARPLQVLPDKAWAALIDQLERTEPGQPWDGVFYFREK